jgi:hypothetical protein
VTDVPGCWRHGTLTQSVMAEPVSGDPSRITLGESRAVRRGWSVGHRRQANADSAARAKASKIIGCGAAGDASRATILAWTMARPRSPSCSAAA